MDEITSSDTEPEPTQVLDASEYPRFFKTGEKVRDGAGLPDPTATFLLLIP